MECRLTQSEEGWKCQVSLRIEFNDETGKRLPDVREKLFGPIVTDPTLLEDVLRRAQLAIINPSVDHTKFVDFDVHRSGPNPPLGSAKQLQFSRNVVCLDLSGPDVTDLSFIDLPVSQFTRVPTSHVLIINARCIGYNIQCCAWRRSRQYRPRPKPRQRTHPRKLLDPIDTDHARYASLITIIHDKTLTINLDDIENQSAAFLAKQVDPKGRRTIGTCGLTLTMLSLT